MNFINKNSKNGNKKKAQCKRKRKKLTLKILCVIAHKVKHENSCLSHSKAFISIATVMKCNQMALMCQRKRMFLYMPYAICLYT